MVKPSILTKAQCDHLATIIAEAEKQTAGEIRLMIVSRSTRAGHAFAALWLVLVLVVLLGLWSLRHQLWMLPDWLLPAVLVGAGIVSWLFSKWPFLQRLFVPPSDMQHAVWTRAEVEFYREGLNHTQGATGILLFVSLFERQAVVLADHAINQKVQQGTWDQVVTSLLDGGRTRDWTGAFEKAIRTCGAILAQHLPAQSKNPNELPNTVIIKD